MNSLPKHSDLQLLAKFISLLAFYAHITTQSDKSSSLRRKQRIHIEKIAQQRKISKRYG